MTQFNIIKHKAWLICMQKGFYLWKSKVSFVATLFLHNFITDNGHCSVLCYFAQHSSSEKHEPFFFFFFFFYFFISDNLYQSFSILVPDNLQQNIITMYMCAICFLLPQSISLIPSCLNRSHWFIRAAIGFCSLSMISIEDYWFIEARSIKSLV